MRAKDAVGKYGRKVASAHVRRRSGTVLATGWRSEGRMHNVAVDDVGAGTAPEAGVPLVRRRGAVA